MYNSNAPEAIWFLSRWSVRSDKVCTANMFTYHSTSLIPHITDIEKITETTALSPDKELQASTDKNSNLQGSGGLNRFFFWWNLEISVSLNSIKRNIAPQRG